VADTATLHAERAALAAGLWRHADWTRVRQAVQPADFFYVRHQEIAAALDELADIGPFLTTATWQDIAPMWPLTMPSAVHVRIGALYTLVDEAPLWVLQQVPKFATGRPEHDALAVATFSQRRQRAEQLRAELAELEAQ
jgi:hypothetical protein